eukprot:scaffold284375_cov71-Attheya_sp.AAC.5
MMVPNDNKKNMLPTNTHIMLEYRAAGVKLWSNNISAHHDDDYAFKQEVDDSGSPASLLLVGVINAILSNDHVHTLHENSNAAFAPEQCESDCDNNDDCIAFLLQDDYRPNRERKKLCFLYKLPRNLHRKVVQMIPSIRSILVALTLDYTPNDGQFFITPMAKEAYNVENFTL